MTFYVSARHVMWRGQPPFLRDTLPRFVSHFNNRASLQCATFYIPASSPCTAAQRQPSTVLRLCACGNNPALLFTGAQPIAGVSRSAPRRARERNPSIPPQIGTLRRPGPRGGAGRAADRRAQPHRAPSMILTQVHLRKPCYDFYFLEVTKFVSLSARRRDARGRRVPRAVREPH